LLEDVGAGLASRRELDDAEYEPRCLVVPGLCVFALWLHDDAGRKGYMVPLGSTDPMLPSGRLVAAEEFRAAVRELARRRLARPEPEHDTGSALHALEPGGALVRVFLPLTLEQFGDLLDRFAFSRTIDAIHMHHTWRPNHAQWRGEPSIRAMWRYHTDERGWSDIAQHVTIAPDGVVWTGRDWNQAPASAAGHNGNAVSGPFMFETVGDFDSGHDRLEGAQREAVAVVIARVQQRFGLGPDSLRFHRSMTTLKSCPGTAVKLAEVKLDVDRVRGSIASALAPEPVVRLAVGFPARASAALHLWSQTVEARPDPMDAELAESDTAAARTQSAASGSPVPRERSTRRRALCVGIDRYEANPLSGCVNDASEWARALRARGFDVGLLLDAQATRERILDELRILIAGSAGGDVLAFAFAGHGTELPDVESDEDSDANGARDEAICPYDCLQGAFVVNDDLAEIFTHLPANVSLTCFIDCCHSGTVTRMMAGPQAPVGAGDQRARFLRASAQLKAAHRTFRRELGRGPMGARPSGFTRQVLFSACRGYEVAWETAGHGDFTAKAIGILADGTGVVTNAEFHARLLAAFGERARQHPELECAKRARDQVFLGAAGNGPPLAHADVAIALRALADRFETGC
jgi:hypothetical protein